jgi:tRNA pseudouridine38-40 synthase
MRYFLELQYKGTNYAGWQIQDNAIAVQQKLNEALSVLLHHNTETIGCGRTDTGVHATQFFAHFDVDKEITHSDKFLFSLNGMLPLDISIIDLHLVDDKAHARFDASERSYQYFIYQTKNPFLKETAMFFKRTLNVELMNQACELFKTYNDFSCFSKSNTQTKTNICSISNAHWIQEDDLLIFSISADRFLRGMVRAIVGTLLLLGEGKISFSDFKSIIESKDRSKAGLSVDAHALYLTSIKYPYINSTKKNTFALRLV